MAFTSAPLERRSLALVRSSRLSATSRGVRPRSSSALRTAERAAGGLVRMNSATSARLWMSASWMGAAVRMSSRDAASSVRSEASCPEAASFWKSSTIDCRQ